MIMVAGLQRRVRVEDIARAQQFPNHVRLGKQFIEVRAGINR